MAPKFHTSRLERLRVFLLRPRFFFAALWDRLLPVREFLTGWRFVTGFLVVVVLGLIFISPKIKKKINTSRAERVTQEAIAAFNEKKPQVGLALSREALRIQPNSQEVLNLCAKICYDNRFFKEELYFLKQLERTHGLNKEAEMHMINALQKMGYEDDAIERLDEFIVQNSDDNSLQFALEYYQKAKDYNKQIYIVEKLAKNSPDSPSLKFKRANLQFHHQLEKIRKAGYIELIKIAHRKDIWGKKALDVLLQARGVPDRGFAKLAELAKNHPFRDDRLLMWVWVMEMKKDPNHIFKIIPKIKDNYSLLDESEQINRLNFLAQFEQYDVVLELLAPGGKYDFKKGSDLNMIYLHLLRKLGLKKKFADELTRNAALLDPGNYHIEHARVNAYLGKTEELEEDLRAAFDYSMQSFQPVLANATISLAISMRAYKLAGEMFAQFVKISQTHSKMHLVLHRKFIKATRSAEIGIFTASMLHARFPEVDEYRNDLAYFLLLSGQSLEYAKDLVSGATHKKRTPQVDHVIAMAEYRFGRIEEAKKITARYLGKPVSMGMAALMASVESRTGDVTHAQDILFEIKQNELLDGETELLRNAFTEVLFSSPEPSSPNL